MTDILDLVRDLVERRERGSHMTFKEKDIVGVLERIAVALEAIAKQSGGDSGERLPKGGKWGTPGF